jgi:NitT/TauT family transport system substrate-binding protein
LGGGAALALAAAGGPLRAAAPTYGKPESAGVRVGTAVDAPSYLPVYVAAAQTWKAAGLDVELVSFRGDAEASQALAGGSIDVNCSALTGLVNMIGAGQPVIGIYAGFNSAGLAWYAKPAIKTWADTKGKIFGVSSFGSTTDALTRYVLRKHGLQPEVDVNLVAVGSTVSEYQALKSDRTQIAIISAPVTWQAQADGFTLLGTQEREVAPQWPEHTYSAKTAYLTTNRNTLAALLRGHVAALRWTRANRAGSVALLVDRIKYTPALAARAYDEVLPTFDERGRLPERSMQVFWDILQRNGDIKEPLPESAVLDHRFIDSFAAWAP